MFNRIADGGPVTLDQLSSDCLAGHDSSGHVYETMAHVSHSVLRRPVARATFAILIAASACRSATGTDDGDKAACPQTYEFGNYGCARLVALVEGPPTPWPASVRFDVRAVPASESSFSGFALASAPGLGAVPLQLTLWLPPPPSSGDTLSMWVRAWMLDAPAGGPYTVFAADSVLRVVRWVPVGAVPPVDTVRLVLRRP